MTMEQKIQYIKEIDALPNMPQESKDKIIQHILDDNKWYDYLCDGIIGLSNAAMSATAVYKEIDHIRRRR